MFSLLLAGFHLATKMGLTVEAAAVVPMPALRRARLNSQYVQLFELRAVSDYILM